MTAIVRVSKTTKKMLDLLKEERHTKTYDQLIRQLLEKQSRVPESMFGAIKGLKKWTKADRMDFHEL